MTAVVDAELYLRLAGERQILSADRSTWHQASELHEIGAALIGAEALDRGAAMEVLDAYAAASALRSNGMGPPWTRRMPSGAPTPPAVTLSLPTRVVACDAILDMPWGRLAVATVSFDDDATRLEVEAWTDAGGKWPRTAGRGGVVANVVGRPPFAQHLANMPVTDDRGYTGISHFNGGGSDTHWVGEMKVAAGLAASTSWLEVGGVRLDLTGPAPEMPAAYVEPVAPGSPAERYLRYRAAAEGLNRRSPDDMLRHAVDALIATGALSAGDAVVAQIDAITAALGMAQAPHHVPGSGSTPSPPPAGAAPTPPALPLEWASVTSRAGTLGTRQGTVPVGAVAGPIDGVTVRIDSLTATEGGFHIRAAMTPGAMTWGPFADPTVPGLAWWARDDASHWYLGGWGDRTGTTELVQGTIYFQPALHPDAGELHLLPSGPTSRGVIVLRRLPGSPA